MTTRRYAQPWPHKAGRVADDVTAALAELGTLARSMDRQMQAIDNMAAMGAEAVERGNIPLARQIFADIRHRTATVRHTAAGMLGAAGTASAALAGARVGEYGDGE